MKTVGLYAGSFNPFHVGHANIVLQAEKVFNKVIIARMINPSKSNVYLTEVDLGFVKKRPFINHHGLLSNLIIELSEKEDAEITLIRGVRNGFDLQYELNLCKAVSDLSGHFVPVVFFRCEPKFDHVSSTLIRELWFFDKNAAKDYLPS
jgi:pantetheine-phosphate adenylyltransferase